MKYEDLVENEKNIEFKFKELIETFEFSINNVSQDEFFASYYEYFNDGDYLTAASMFGLFIILFKGAKNVSRTNLETLMTHLNHLKYMLKNEKAIEVKANVIRNTDEEEGEHVHDAEQDPVGNE